MERTLRVVITSFGLIAHLLAFLQLWSISPNLPANWGAELSALIIGSGLLALGVPRSLTRLFVWAGLAPRALILLIVGMPLGENLTVEAALFSALTFDAMVYLPAWGGFFFLGLVLAALLLLQQPLAVGAKIQAVPGGLDLVCFVLLAAGLMLVARLVRLFLGRLRSAAEIQARLREATGQLARTNIELQEFAASTEQKATLNERKRLARELHDSLGYSLTNLVMMLEAGMCMLKDAYPELREHLQRARDLSQEGLQEMRRTFRLIRQKEAETVAGIKAVFRLVKSFEQATHLDVKLHLGDVPWTLGPDKDQIVYRFVQEGISNALRHGNATSISIVFCRRDEGVLVSINDNGSGFSEMAEGGGLVGMRERIEKVGGYNSISSQPGLGTVLSAWLPIENR